MDIKYIDSIDKLYSFYKDNLPGNLVIPDNNNIIWNIDDDTSLFINTLTCKINLVAYKKVLVKLAKNDLDYYKEDMSRFYKDVHNIISKLKKGENKELFYARKYCISLNKNRNRRFVIGSIIITIFLLMICYSILFGK